MSKSLVDIIATANPAWINGTRIDRTADGKWQVSAPSRFAAKAFAVEINADLGIALRDAWGPYGSDDAEVETIPVPQNVETLLQVAAILSAAELES